MRSATGRPDGVVLLDKPSGITSHDAVSIVRRTLGTRKVGHAGTLDPMATGLLVVGVGRATRLLRFLGDLTKSYEGTGVLGIETTTLDAEGEVVRKRAVRVSEGELREAMGAFLGEIEQVPPAYSAIKVGGQRLYRAAREGRSVDAPPRRVRVERFDLQRFDPPRFSFAVDCSGGTYVRSLVADVGDRLGCGAHLAGLRRVAIGMFSVADATSTDVPRVLPVESVVAHLPAVSLTDEEARAAAHGRLLGPAGLAGPYRVTAPNGGLIAIYRDDGAKAVPEVVLAPA